MAITSNTTPSNQNFALFEGSSIKQFIIEQLNKGGIFIDQQYLGSNLNAFIDIIAVMLQQLQFHLIPLPLKILLLRRAYMKI